MLTERKWDNIPPRAFALAGGADGSVFLASTKNFKVKQKVAISATGLPSLSLEVKKVLSPTQLIVGPFSSKMSDKTDLSQYTLLTNPTIRAEEQDRSGIPTEQHERAVYAEEPIIAKRVILVDEVGQYFNETNPLPISVDGNSVQLLDKLYDSGTETYPLTTQEVVTTFIGGLSGIPVQRITLNYSDATKENLINFQRENWNGLAWVVG